MRPEGPMGHGTVRQQAPGKRLLAQLDIAWYSDAMVFRSARTGRSAKAVSIGLILTDWCY